MGELPADLVAQLVRAPVTHSKRRGFKSDLGKSNVLHRPSIKLGETRRKVVLDRSPHSSASIKIISFHFIKCKCKATTVSCEFNWLYHADFRLKKKISISSKKKKHGNFFKNWLCPNFSCCPKFGGAVAPPAPVKTSN